MPIINGDEHVNYGRDFNPNRELLLDNGNKYHVQKRDPYGHWYIHMDKGRVPDRLSGSYTSFELAKKAVESYVALADKKIVEVNYYAYCPFYLFKNKAAAPITPAS